MSEELTIEDLKLELKVLPLAMLLILLVTNGFIVAVGFVVFPSAHAARAAVIIGLSIFNSRALAQEWKRQEKQLKEQIKKASATTPRPPRLCDKPHQ